MTVKYGTPVPPALRWTALGLVSSAALLLPLAVAQAKPDNGTISFQVENDVFAYGNKDRHYSNGLRVSWLPTPDPGDPGLFERAARSLPFFSRPDYTQRIGWSVGQSIFTPQDKLSSGPLPDDRPYAAWLYAGVTLINASKPNFEAGGAISELDTLEIDVGMVGRAALGKMVQRAFHDWAFKNADVKGWDNQLKSEPGLLISYNHKWRASWQADFGHLGVDVFPSIGFDLGNVQTSASAGLMARFGRDLPADFGPPRIRPGLVGSDFFLSDTDSGRRLGWYVFAGAEGRAVARNIFLDGNSFATSLKVRKKHFVADLQAGVAVILYGVRLTATQVLRTREFHGQKGNDVFGAVSASFNF
jgi:lipid A 3-O-deacylase